MDCDVTQKIICRDGICMEVLYDCNGNLVNEEELRFMV